MISVLIPTRGRPEKLLNAISSLDETAADPDQVSIVVGADLDDPPTVSLPRPVTRCHLVWSAAPREDSLGAKCNRCARVVPASLTLYFSDDMLMKTAGWDRKLRGTAELYPDGIGIIYFGEHFGTALPAFMAVTSGWLSLFGGFYNEHFPYSWWIDTWLDEIAQMSGRVLWMPIRTEGQDGNQRGKTMGLQEITWWAEFFDRTRSERIEIADRALDVLYPNEPYRAAQLRQQRPAMVKWFSERNSYLRRPEIATDLERQMSENAASDERYMRAKQAAIHHLEEIESKEQVFA